MVVVPSESAIGRAVVYRHGENDPPVTGVITRVAPRRLFVRLGSQPYSMAVDPAELEFIARRRSDAVRPPRRRQTVSRTV
jgi:hypothetical protein